MSHHVLVERIRHEYRALPGLSLTAWQLQRLFAADEPSCRAAVETLVAEGFLQRTPSRTFVRSARVTAAAYRGETAAR